MRCSSCGQPLAHDSRCACGGHPVLGPPPEVLRFRVAGFWRRMIAALVDTLLLAPVVVLSAIAAARVAGVELPRSLAIDLVADLVLEGDPAALLTGGLAAVLGFVYLFTFSWLRGQTLGKRLLGVRVITAFGEAPGAGRTLLRLVGYLVSAALLALGFVWIAFDREKRGWHDRIAGTYVVRAT